MTTAQDQPACTLATCRFQYDLALDALVGTPAFSALVTVRWERERFAEQDGGFVSRGTRSGTRQWLLRRGRTEQYEDILAPVLEDIAGARRNRHYGDVARLESYADDIRARLAALVTAAAAAPYSPAASRDR